MKFRPLIFMTVVCHGCAISINIKIVCRLCGWRHPGKIEGSKQNSNMIY